MALIVNGQRIDDEAIRQEAERMRPQYEQAFADDDPAARENRLREWARENVIEQALLDQEARRDGRPIPADDVSRMFDDLKEQAGSEATLCEQLGVATVAEARERIELRLRVNRLIEQFCSHAPEPTDQAVQDYYAAHQDELMAPETVRVAHIVKHPGPGCSPEAAKAQLEQVRQELEQGADFAEMAAQHSDCPDNGGDLGYFARGQMVEEFEDVVFAMAVGRVSHVFPTRFGFHVAKLLERRPPAPYELDAVRDRIREQLTRDARNKAVEAHLDRLRAKAIVEEV